MRRLSKVVNIVPVIAKADTLTLEERDYFKQTVSVARLAVAILGNCVSRGNTQRLFVQSTYLVSRGPRLPCRALYKTGKPLPSCSRASWLFITAVNYWADWLLPVGAPLWNMTGFRKLEVVFFSLGWNLESVISTEQVRTELFQNSALLHRNTKVTF